MEVNEEFIRRNFHRKVLAVEHACADTLILNELGLRHGDCRADIAVINGELAGYEIKSDRDSLIRLGKQIRYYGAVFNRVAVVVAPRHVKSVLSLLPTFWGVFVCHASERNEPDFEVLREADENDTVDATAIAQLLWRQEAISILSELGCTASVLRQRRAIIYRELAENVALTELRSHVINRLKSRRNWRPREPLFQYDDSYRLAATS